MTEALIQSYYTHYALFVNLNEERDGKVKEMNTYPRQIRDKGQWSKYRGLRKEVKALEGELERDRAEGNRLYDRLTEAAAGFVLAPSEFDR